MRKFKVIICFLLLISIVYACNSKENEVFSYGEVKNEKIEHIHGLGYINGGSDFTIATHLGLYKYGNEGWEETNSQKHDYMGFQAVREGFISSGHPEEGSEYKNPLGLIKSVDKGATFEQLAFYGEIDFHYLAAGYDTNSIYVLNEMPTEQMNKGLYYSEDEGATWKKAAMNGFNTSFISNLSAHPKRKELIAIGSKEGMFVSDDYGENFKKINDENMITYITLNETGGYYTNFDDQNVYLKSFSYENKEEKDIQLPKDYNLVPIIYIATNPDNRKEIVIVNNNNDIYLTKDGGSKWEKLASNGELIK